VLWHFQWSKTSCPVLRDDVWGIESKQSSPLDSYKLTNKMQQFYKFITWRSYVAQHVSGVFPPIIRSKQLFWESLLLPLGAHTRTSLARESASGSLTREPGSDIFHHTRMSGFWLVTLHTRTSLTHWNPSPAGLASQTHTCMGTFSM